MGHRVISDDDGFRYIPASHADASPRVWIASRSRSCETLIKTPAHTATIPADAGDQAVPHDCSHERQQVTGPEARRDHYPASREQAAGGGLHNARPAGAVCLNVMLLQGMLLPGSTEQELHSTQRGCCRPRSSLDACYVPIAMPLCAKWSC